MASTVVAATPIAAASAPAPHITLVSAGAASGIVAHNTVWPGRAITWTVAMSGAPSRDRVVTQVLTSRHWTSVSTQIVSRGRTSAKGSFYPLLGRRSYRVALTSPSGHLVAVSRSWAAVGFATESVTRVVTPAPRATGYSFSRRGASFPALWHYSTTHIRLPYTGFDYTVAAGRCRAFLFTAAVSYTGNPGEVAHANISGSWKPTPLVTIVAAGIVEATDPPGLPVSAGGVPTAFIVTDRSAPLQLMMNADATIGTWTTPWVSGDAWGGGVGLCSSVVR